MKTETQTDERRCRAPIAVSVHMSARFHGNSSPRGYHPRISDSRHNPDAAARLYSTFRERKAQCRPDENATSFERRKFYAWTDRVQVHRRA